MNIYQSLYDLLNTYIYGNSIVAGGVADLVCTIASTAGCLALVAIPFVLVYRIMKLIAG